jgi:hypothetical protein
MKKDEYRRWFADQLSQQNRILTGATAALVGLGLIAALIEATLFGTILRFGILSSSWLTAYFVSFCIQGVMLFVTFLRLSKQLPDTEHEVELEERFTIIRTAPTMSTVWTYALEASKPIRPGSNACSVFWHCRSACCVRRGIHGSE